MIWLQTCLHYSIPKQSWRSLVLLGNTSILDVFLEGGQEKSACLVEVDLRAEGAVLLQEGL